MDRGYRAAIRTALAAGAVWALAGHAVAATMPANVAALRSALDATLLDYAHARFRDVHIRQAADGTFVACGKVNAPNRAGGFTGWMAFMGGSAKGGGAFVVAAANDMEDHAIGDNCDVRTGPDYSAQVAFRAGR